MKRRRSSRLAVAAVCVGLVAIVGTVGRATSAFGYGATTTTSTSTTSSTTSTSTTTSSSTTTTVPLTTTSIGATPGSTVPSGAGNTEEPGTSANTATPGSSLTVDAASSPTTSGTTQSGAGATQPAPCGANVPVSIFILLIQTGSTPTPLTTATSNATGGLDPISVTIPKNTGNGTYVITAQCNNSDGILEVLTSPLVLVSSIPGASVSARVPASYTTSAHYGTPAERTALESAVRTQIARVRSGTASTASPNNEVQYAITSLARPADPASGSRTLSYVLAGVVLVLVAAGLFTIRRRRTLPTS